MPYVEADAAPLVDEGIAGSVGVVITSEPESGSGVAAPSYADAAPWYVTERALAGNLLRLLAARVAIGVAGGVGADGDGGASVPVKPVCMWCGTVQFDPEPPRRDHDGSPLCCICFIRSETVPVEPNPAPLVAERTRGTMDESEAGGPEAGVRKRRKTIGDVINEKLREAREGHLASAVATSIPPTPTTQVTTEKAHHAVDTTARSTRISDETYTKVAPRLLRMMMRAGPSGFSSHELATSMRGMKVTSSIVIAVARQLDTVLAVEPTRGRARGALAISVRPGAEDEVRKIERSLTAHARKARAAAAPS
jgi:hypothetical protein